jgi:glucose-6-phosphate isomerase
MYLIIGLPIILSIGFEYIVELLEGAHEMDQHFKQASFKENLLLFSAYRYTGCQLFKSIFSGCNIL